VVSREPMVFRDHRVPKVLVVFISQMGFTIMDHKGIKDMMDLQDLLEIKDHKERKVLLGIRDHKDLLAKFSYIKKYQVLSITIKYN
jgi:hypothetical protein